MRSYRLSGLLSPVVSLIGIPLAIYFNRSWFSLTDNAISDLGNIYHPWVSHPYVLSITLIFSALLGMHYILGLMRGWRNKVSRVGGGVMFFCMLSLLHIGVFPEGTWPHYYVSWGFFLLGSFGMFIIGIAALFKREARKFGIITIFIFLIAWLLAIWALHTFKGVAIAELIGAITLSLWIYLTIFWYSPLEVFR